MGSRTFFIAVVAALAAGCGSSSSGGGTSTGAAPTVAITSPAAGGTVTVTASGSPVVKSAAVAFKTTNFKLAEPGACGSEASSCRQLPRPHPRLRRRQRLHARRVALQQRGRLLARRGHPERLPDRRRLAHAQARAPPRRPLAHHGRLGPDDRGLRHLHGAGMTARGAAAARARARPRRLRVVLVGLERSGRRPGGEAATYAVCPPGLDASYGDLLTRVFSTSSCGTSTPFNCHSASGASAEGAGNLLNFATSGDGAASPPARSTPSCSAPTAAASPRPTSRGAPRSRGSSPATRARASSTSS